MDGKPTIKIMSKIQLLNSLRLNNTEDVKVKKLKKFSSRKRGSTPLISTSISVQRKGNNQSVTRPKVQNNNFTTTISHNIFSITSAKRLSHCQTAMAIRPVRRQEPAQKTQTQKVLLKYSDKVHKLFWNEINENLPPLIISADFLMDQDSFWSVPKINANANKYWKDIHRNHYVIWTIKFQKGMKILKDYCDAFQLPLNAVYYQKRQSRLTVDYVPLKKQLNKVYGQQLKEIKLIECLKMNIKDSYQQNSFLGRVPLMLDSRLRVCYVRSQESGSGIEKIAGIARSMSLLKQQKITELTSVPIFIENYFRNIQQQRQDQKDFNRANIFEKFNTEFIDEEEAERQVQDFKRQLIETVIKQKGRNFQYEGFSVHYFVGDIIKRNYQALLNNATKRLQTQPRLRALDKTQRKIEQKQLGIAQKFYQYYQ